MSVAPMTGPVPMAPPAPIRPRRRVGMVVAGIVLIIIGGLVTTWIVSSQTSASQVLAITKSVPRGAKISSGDLTAVPVAGGTVLQTVPADQASDVVGKVAATDLLAGSLLTTGSYADALTPADGRSLIGVTVDVAHRPASPLHAGDRVRVIQSPAAGGDIAPDAAEISAVVMAVSVVDGATTVDVEVALDDAGVLAQMAASGRATLVLDPPGGKKAAQDSPGSAKPSEDEE